MNERDRLDETGDATAPDGKDDGGAALSRRGFVRALALGGAALATGGAPAALARTTKPASTHVRASVAPVTGVRAEIEKQKKSTQQTLKTIRDHHLPDGSPVAFVFRPRPAIRKAEPK